MNSEYETKEGTGQTIEDAIRSAHNKFTSDNNVADALFVSSVVEFGIRTGGIAAVDEFFVKVRNKSLA